MTMVSKSWRLEMYLYFQPSQSRKDSISQVIEINNTPNIISNGMYKVAAILKVLHHSSRLTEHKIFNITFQRLFFTQSVFKILQNSFLLLKYEYHFLYDLFSQFLSRHYHPQFLQHSKMLQTNYTRSDFFDKKSHEGMYKL